MERQHLKSAIEPRRSLSSRAARIVGASAVPTAVSLVALAALTLIALLAMGRSFTGTPQFVAALWLAVNHAPLTADGVTLGMLPLLPTLLFGAAVAWQARSTAATDAEAAARSLPGAEPGLPTPAMQAASRAFGISLAGLVLVPLAVTTLAIMVLNSASTDFPVRADAAGSALAWSGVINLVAALAGGWWAHHGWLRRRIPHVVVAGIHIGLAYLAGIFAVGGVAVAISLVANWSDLTMLFDMASGDAWGVFALGALSLAYSPNVLVLMGAIVVGGQAHIGEASASVFSVAPGQLPALPLLAAWPASTPHWLWQGLLVVAALIAIGVARATAHCFATTRDGVVACLVAAAVCIISLGAAEPAAGGEVGLLGSAGFAPLLTCALVAVWIGVLGSATMALSLIGVERRRTAHEERVRRRRERLAQAERVRAEAVSESAKKFSTDESGFDDDVDADSSEELPFSDAAPATSATTTVAEKTADELADAEITDELPLVTGTDEATDTDDEATDTDRERKN